ncbi:MULTISPECIES: hypothetical protein [unclassified Novosphingobium]|uniref:hypothetical protein n=1 Tax=unclassified Novosphingobium TaxID=2644732 RepID=UPI00135C7B83|nr:MULTISPECIES: hypothetical protein [unclassified Novosphingobium]
MNLNKQLVAAVSLAIASAPSAAALAQSGPAVATYSAVFIERIAPGSDRSLEPASALARGDQVFTVVTWYRMGGDGGFVLTNPLPARLAYQRSASDMQEVSVNGGRSWGRLENLRMGTRQATAEDVTHVRWRIPASSAARGRGQIAYSGIVRS